MSDVTATATATATAKPTPVQALGVVAAVVVLVALYLMIGAALQIVPLYAGFFFLLYWSSMRQMGADEFLPAVVGSLGGLGTGWLLHVAPTAYGTAGLVAMLVLISVAIYLQVRGELVMLVNPGFMLFLTLATVPPVAAQDNFQGMALSILFAAVFFGGLFFLARTIGQRRKRSSQLPTSHQ